jgi:RNA polymerase sigma-70 factor, ECF subfamily
MTVESARDALICTEGVVESPSQGQITKLLQAWSDGDLSALEQLTLLVNDELHRLAKRYLARERNRDILQSTALLNEAYLQLVCVKNVRFQDRAHFYNLSARIMRRILVNISRKPRSRQVFEPLDGHESAKEKTTDLVALDDALKALEELYPRQGRVVEYRFFGGLSQEETAELLGISVDTVQEDWKRAKAWLFREVKCRK